MSKLDIIMIGPFPEDLAHIKGGVQASVLGLSLALSERDDVAVQVLSLPVDKHSKQMRIIVNGIDVTYLGMPMGYQAASIFHLPKILCRIKSVPHPILHIHGTGLLQTVLCALARSRKLPMVWTLHGITEKETFQRFQQHKTVIDFTRYIFYRILERVALRIAPTVIVDTQYVKDEVRARGNMIHVIPQGINTQELAFPSSRQDQQAPRILSIGAVDIRKGHHITLAAFAKIKQQLPQAHLVIMGMLTVPDYYRALTKQIVELGLSDSVELIADASRSQILAQLGQASVFALHSQEESQGIALCEALATGLPIVTTRVGGIPYVINDGQNGLLVTYGDIDGFSAALLRLFTDQSLYVHCAKQARLSSRRFDWKTITDSVVSLYR